MGEEFIAEKASDRPAMLPASARSRGAMIASLCEAFADDPGLNWIWPDREDRVRRLPYFFKAIVAGTLANGVVLHSARSDAVSLWRQPGRINPGRLEIFRGLPSMAVAFGVGRERSKLMSETLKAHQPVHFAWWYLQFIGVRPTMQGIGLGGAAVCAGLDLARSAGMPVYVEVMNAANVGYYHHIGFETVDEFDIPEGGPHVWAMIHHINDAARSGDS
ncbi:GNAT family N-acetyltransferase [Sphingobium sp. BYY-5]|uniref:GNAT family N-acetyltransferase n=1 Tax=Sphingobium sp. BYY-5 TaxID=2926400 RepID=UPI001FA807EB|nr:GNAT family N-acetyltransferase [Sphingobium sp. BYY-5]MCI4590243.1 GNAT family N-acetyltransferase [Sphingobium sp. BYY-5]